MKIIKISTKSNVKCVIDYIIEQLNNDINEIIYICGLSQAISKLILIVEVIKTKVIGLHQINKIDCLVLKNSLNQEYRRIPKMDIIISRIEPLIKDVGYQSPYEKKFIKLKCNDFKKYKRGTCNRKRGAHFKISPKYNPNK